MELGKLPELLQEFLKINEQRDGGLNVMLHTPDLRRSVGRFCSATEEDQVISAIGGLCDVLSTFGRLRTSSGIAEDLNTLASMKNTAHELLREIDRVSEHPQTTASIRISFVGLRGNLGRIRKYLEGRCTAIDEAFRSTI